MKIIALLHFWKYHPSLCGMRYVEAHPVASLEDMAVTRQLVEAGKLLGAGTGYHTGHHTQRVPGVVPDVVVLDRLMLGYGRWVC